ncbi:MmcQ/YjbR family DNA-binding protein [Paenibacillus spongiae]|uniref:MmcQ/YjbR family DNA-binding protein n=1 Tax=Paenibacillus spongiae TaxID=2909671 RepID=A0ABY5SEJ1_9BACL|nr:MmcQ/YjbR family DNA-binding protein [Paenibacillus spongiae]UVI31135.1 MmcQ/YjbR family DNA-binding protein [Paenibacillus spongiae]
MEILTEYCSCKPGAEQTYPFGPQPLVMKVGGKMFALISPDHISLKCDPVIAENLREQHAAVTPGYHLNKKHWNTVHVDGALALDELTDMIDHSYELVFKSLPKTVRNRLEQASGNE